MSRSLAQKQADKKYREKTKHSSQTWGTKVKPDFAQKLNAALLEAKMNRVEFLKWGLELLEKKTPN